MGSSLTVTGKGQVTLTHDLLQHFGIKPGKRVDLEKLSGGELRVRAARRKGTIDTFYQILDGKVNVKKPLSIEAMNKIASAGWAGELSEKRSYLPARTCLRGPFCKKTQRAAD